MAVIIHRPRVAWEGARVFVRAAPSDAYWWLGDMVGHYLGVMYQLKLAETRLRLQLEDVVPEEIGAWRFRLDELLRDRPELTGLLGDLIEETSYRLPR
ncbi:MULTISPECIES: hypothetical protein [Microtetraspora]|uniref:Uncharacterized protein n=1 Tax=Microtetraspora glauca TaxID=1996 RepID=A0ABV3GQ48_MICGL|nr:hypothetical protein [Microtetraspora sp. AC03309]MCC5582029.1 hypothetical protein [Microtetraspora sp. AC03309]